MENGRRLRSAWDAEFLLVIDSCQEMYFVYAKIQPYLTDLREKTGMADFYDRLDREEKDLPPPPPEGDDWDFEDDDEMRRRFPRLCHLYLIPQEDGGE